MILKLTNKSENFYNYLGKFFGSRIVEITTQDRIYDDNNKTWYIYLESDVVTSFISIANDKIKNIYSTNSDHLEKLLNYLKEDTLILPSTVTNAYVEIYTKCNFNISSDNYKNFVKIWSKENE
ncbi:MAG: hypothetical protein Q4D02_02675 [Clostridia bacterium]|nr:hypothetical protein [Clostridia bacterium]